eukprot:CAMPEP_0115834862 /NCGR_PEP_ID=MMETSP0287-20121206/3900_1 /TAXON_ID=412157 /ORGANISM="Chrysochromulina rotalis, Strain UIO044" /LENGTH=290 /DNA_ID=CAMNT_0003288307 /DNA_START=63 /DNA_END=935 /DNA_ORIENTATION=+
MSGPLILLSPAKSLNFERKLAPALAAIKPTRPKFGAAASKLSVALSKLSKSEIKKLMSLSETLAALNHERFTAFDAQPSRAAICAFEGQAYKGLDAPSLSTADLAYCQDHLRILCGLYGIIAPFDEIRPYRLEMSTKLACPGGHSNLYAFWGDQLTQSIEAEHPAWVLNVASQEYAKSIDLQSLSCPVITASFPGPAVYAKAARGEMVRFCAINRVTKPEALQQFRGSGDLWSFVAGASDERTFVFHRGAASSSAAKKNVGAKRAGGKVADASTEEAEEQAAPSKSRRKA